MAKDTDFLKIDSISNKKLEFLNLEFSDRAFRTQIKGNENYKLACRISDDFKHILHSEDNHLNSITDLIINLGINLQKEINYNKQQLEKSLEELRKYTENLDYIKDQQQQILLEIKQINKGKSGINHSLQSDNIDKLTETLKNLKINETKIKPTPYKHWQPRK